MLIRREIADSYLALRVLRDLRDRIVDLAIARNHTLSEEVRTGLLSYLAEAESRYGDTLVGATDRNRS